MLSFKNGRTLARIKGGRYSDKTLKIMDSVSKCCNRCGTICVLKQCCKKCCLLEEIKGRQMGDFLKLEEGRMIPKPNRSERDTVYVAGPSGSGKSTYIGEYANEYSKMYPKNPIFLFSRKPEDKALDFLDPIRITIDEELVEDPIDALSELNDSLVIFDDTDTIQEPDIKKAVSKLKNDILETGRAYNIYIIVSSHLINPNDRKDSRTILNECSSLTIFPKSGSTYQINYSLKNYFGMSPQQIKDILELPSRWVTIFKNYPQAVLYEKGAYALNKYMHK